MSQSEPETGSEPSASVAQAETTSSGGALRGARWPWAVLFGAVVLGLAVGGGLGLRGSAIVAPPGSEVGARPTILIVGSASPSAVVRSPVPVASAAPELTPLSADEYVVVAGDTMRSIARAVYGDADLWPRIYTANRDRIGPNPDALQAGMRLVIPQP